MESLIEYLQFFEHNYFPCKLCKDVLYTAKDFLDHLDECECIQDEPKSLYFAFFHNAKWKFHYNEWRRLNRLIALGGRPFQKDECVGCATTDIHLADGCRKVDRSVAYNKSTTVVLRLISSHFENYLVERSNFAVDYVNREFDCERNNLQYRLSVNTAECEWAVNHLKAIGQNPHFTEQYALREIEDIKSKLDSLPQRREIALEKIIEEHTARRDEDWHHFQNTMNKIVETDLAAHQSFDIKFRISFAAAKSRNPGITIRNFGPNFDDQIEREIILIRQDVLRKQKTKMRLEHIRISLEDRLEYVINFDTRRDRVNFEDDHRRMRLYNQAADWYHELIEDRQSDHMRGVAMAINAIKERNLETLRVARQDYETTRPYAKKLAAWAMTATWALGNLQQGYGRVTSPTARYESVFVQDADELIFAFDEFVTSNLLKQIEAVKTFYRKLRDSWIETKVEIREEGGDSEGKYKELHATCREFLETLKTYEKEDAERYATAEAACVREMKYVNVEAVFSTVSTFRDRPAEEQEPMGDGPIN
ncbi:unnamed protein product [Caenorhabditis sp. 36 PRJEB53466]|nr:unnamed protein product [Caenorhabditis sp. 36 PRJEB53466]